MKTPKTTPTETIHADWWEPGETVTIKTYLSGWDKMQLQAHLKRASAAAEQADLDEGLASYEMALRYMEFGVVAISLTFADGSPVQVDFEDYKRLSDRDVNYICSTLKDRIDRWAKSTPAGTEEDRRQERFPAEQTLPARVAGEAQARRPAPRGSRDAAAV